MFQFERAVCVSLARRNDRWQNFHNRLPADWPFRTVERFDAVDGKKVPAPQWWKAGPGAWGCYKSHLRILEQCLENDIDSCLFMEDDAVCCEDFVARTQTFFKNLPEDWSMIYLGGQHLGTATSPPIQVNPHVYIPFDVNRTHAFGVRGRTMMQTLYKHLNAFKDWKTGFHIDHQLGQIHRQRSNPIYCPSEWLIGQDEGTSDVSGRKVVLRFFPAAESYSAVEKDFVCVMGLHRSGSSCLAMMLHKLGVHMGNDLGGYEAIRGGGGEAAGLVNICESAMPFPSQDIECWPGRLQANFLTWIRERQKEVEDDERLAGGKHPNLCAMGSLLETTLKGRMKVIHINRPLQESIDSLVQREPAQDSKVITNLQKFLWKSKQEFLRKTNVPVLTVEYDDVLKKPTEVVDRIVNFLGIEPLESQRANAIAHPKPKYRHFVST